MRAPSHSTVPIGPGTGALAIGVDVGGTKVVAGLVDVDGAVLVTSRRDTPGHDVVAVQETIAALVEELVEQAGSQRVQAVGVGAAGLVSADGDVVLFSPHLAWRHEGLRAGLERRLTRPVLVENDANGAAWAEWRFGAGRGETRLLCVTVGTGIGGGLVLDGRLERGRHGLAAEFGHMVLVPGGFPCECGNRGCWEQYASGNALGRRARELVAAGVPAAGVMLALAGGEPAAVVGTLVTQAARDGNTAARGLLAEVGTWLGLGLANLGAALDPGTVVVGGGVSAAGELLLGPARQTLSRNLTGRGYRPLMTVVAAGLGPVAGVVGVADLARRSLRRMKS